LSIVVNGPLVALGQPQSGRPSNFDYYLFTLSSSPEYCHSIIRNGNHAGPVVDSTFDAITIPGQFLNPGRSFTIHPGDVKQAFEQANPKITDSSIAVNCPQNFLTGIQICVSKTGTPIGCPPNAARDCRANTIRVPPVR
jgi:ribonuclease I